MKWFHVENKINCDESKLIRLRDAKLENYRLKQHFPNLAFGAFEFDTFGSIYFISFISANVTLSN